MDVVVDAVCELGFDRAEVVLPSPLPCSINLCGTAECGRRDACRSKWLGSSRNVAFPLPKTASWRSSICDVCSTACGRQVR